jgi:hypothetical protein
MVQKKFKSILLIYNNLTKMESLTIIISIIEPFWSPFVILMLGVQVPQLEL